MILLCITCVCCINYIHIHEENRNLISLNDNLTKESEILSLQLSQMRQNVSYMSSNLNKTYSLYEEEHKCNNELLHKIHELQENLNDSQHEINRMNLSLHVREERINYLENILYHSDNYILKKSISHDELDELLNEYRKHLLIRSRWICFNYAYDFVRFARDHNIYASTCTIVFKDDGHMIACLYVDGNLTYIEPQTGYVVSCEEGKDYLIENGFQSDGHDGTVEDIDCIFFH